jgi:hypothetical protein
MPPLKKDKLNLIAELSLLLAQSPTITDYYQFHKDLEYVHLNSHQKSDKESLPLKDNV